MRSMTGTAEILAPLIELPGVADGVEQARNAAAQVYDHPANRQGWPAAAAEAQLRAARASAALDGGPTGPPVDGPVDDPVLAGALRAADGLGKLLPIWRRAPLQALARLHLLAAADLVPEAERDGALGRPRGDPDVSRRLELLAALVTDGDNSPGPVLVAVVHGELLTLAPFGTADGVVARAAARLTAVVSGLDPKGLAIPEVGHLRRVREYRQAAAGFAGGTAEGVTEWLLHCCRQWRAGASEALTMAAARTPDNPSELA